MSEPDSPQELIEQLTRIISQNADNIDAIAEQLGVSLEDDDSGADKARFFGFQTAKKSRREMSDDAIAGEQMRANARNLARIARKAGAPRSKISEGAVKDDRPEQKAKLFGTTKAADGDSEEKTKAEFLGLE